MSGFLGVVFLIPAVAQFLCPRNSTERGKEFIVSEVQKSAQAK
jgi:hypothetical protein